MFPNKYTSTYICMHVRVRAKMPKVSNIFPLVDNRKKKNAFRSYCYNIIPYTICVTINFYYIYPFKCDMDCRMSHGRCKIFVRYCRIYDPVWSDSDDIANNSVPRECSGYPSSTEKDANFSAPLFSPHIYIIITILVKSQCCWTSTSISHARG